MHAPESGVIRYILSCEIYGQILFSLRDLWLRDLWEAYEIYGSLRDLWELRDLWGVQGVRGQVITLPSN